MTTSKTDPLKYFRIESAELIDKLTRGLLALEKKGYRAETIDGLNRAAHSLKGAARLVELFAIGDLAHAMESRLAEIRDAKKVRKADVGELLKQLDQVDTMVREALADPAPGSAADRPEAAAQPSREETAGEAPPEERADVSTTPPVDDRIAWVPTQILDRIGHCAGLLVELGRRAREWSRKLEVLRDSMRSLAARLEAAGGEAAEARIDAGALRGAADSVIEEVGSGLDGIGPLGQRLYSLTIEARVVCIEEVSHRFEKTVRDVAVELGRLASLTIAGRELLVDRVSLQRLMEPICHLLRNAVVHGIETPAERRDLGKPEGGRVGLRFEKLEDHVRISVEDDGRGLDADLIRRAASGSGDPPDDRELRENDVAGLIFRPGLSTQERLSKVAGRGVGLDVVRSAAEELGGSVRVCSERGRFCRFTIEVPANLDVMDVFVVTVGAQDLLIPMSRMVGTRLVEKEDVVTIAGKDVLLVDSFPVPLLSLAGVLDIPRHDIPRDREEGTRIRVAVVRSGTQRFALAADDLRGKQRVAVKGVDAELASRVIAGHAPLPDGRNGFLLHVDALAELARGGSFAVRREPRREPAARRSVLVVDDSLTSRMNEKAILESAGYSVHVARDGQEALGLLPHVRCDLVILDYEMPGMNGLDVAERIRAIPDYAGVPMVMLSSVDSRDVRSRAAAAGLRAYLVKGEFDQNRFLDTVRESLSQLEPS